MSKVKNYIKNISLILLSIIVYLLFISIYNLIKYNIPLMISSKVINVVASLVSFISLEIISLSPFGSDVNFFEIMIISTGGEIIIIISLYMIIKSTEWINNN